jgi:hypothetical protein
MNEKAFIDGKTVSVKATVTEAFSGKTFDTECELALKHTDQFGWIVRVVNGSLIGPAYFGINGLNRPGQFESGWLACAGRPGQYDRLFISGSEMKRALVQLGINQKEK